MLNQGFDAINIINRLLNQAQKIQQYGISDQDRNDLFRQAQDEALELSKLRDGVNAFGQPNSNSNFTRLVEERFSDLLDQYGLKNGKLQVEVEPV